MLGDNIKRLRKLHKMTTIELADKIGVSDSYISQLENNKKQNPSIELIQRIADIFNVKPSFLYEEGSPTPLDLFKKELPEDILGFIASQKNRPYVVFAKDIAESDLPEEDKEELIEFIRFHIKKLEEKKKQ